MLLNRHGRAVRHVVQAVVRRIIQRLADLVLPGVVRDLIVRLKEPWERGGTGVSVGEVIQSYDPRNSFPGSSSMGRTRDTVNTFKYIV